jgi:hypothetical protein
MAGFPAAIGLHFLAWAGGGLQVWIGARLLGQDLTLAQAIALESLVYAGRAIFFFIPAGVGVQEAGIVALGALMKIDPAHTLAIALLLRGRDLICGAPGLLAWLAVERAGGAETKG